MKEIRNSSIEIIKAVAQIMTEQKDEETRADSDLRDHLHQMEARVRKLRDARNNHNEQAKRFACLLYTSDAADE